LSDATSAFNFVIDEGFAAIARVPVEFLSILLRNSPVLVERDVASSTACTLKMS
jgi:hypothetical protein